MCSNTLLNSLDSRHPLAFSSSSFSTLSFHHITRLLLLCLEREEHDIKHTEKSRCRLLLFALQLAAIVHPTQACMLYKNSLTLGVWAEKVPVQNSAVRFTVRLFRWATQPRQILLVRSLVFCLADVGLKFDNNGELQKVYNWTFYAPTIKYIVDNSICTWCDVWH